MGKYTEDVKRLLECVGGAENISTVTHCATRLRFVLARPAKADVKEIEKIPSVKGQFTQAGQFQIIIGNDVKTFYNEFTAYSGVLEKSKDDVKADAKRNMTVPQRMMATLAEIFSPLIPALVVGGLLLGLRNVLEGIPLVTGADGAKITLTQASVFLSGLNHFLWLICEAVFFFLPVGITWSVTKKMGGTEILGVVLGICLVSPQLLNAYAVASTAAEQIPVWDFGFAKIRMIGYQAQVIPAILAGLTLAYLERFFRRIIPQAISMIFVPLFSLVPAALFAHACLGPFGWWVGSGISTVIYSGLTGHFRAIFAAIFGFFYAPLVVTGLHHMTNAIDLQLMSEFGGTNLWPMIALSNIAQGSAVLAVIFLHRGDKKEEQVSIPAMISCYLGVTEPAMFGINLKYFFPFIAAMTGSAAAAVISAASGVMANSIGVGGIPGILSIKPQYFGVFAVCMLTAIALPFALTAVFNRLGVFKKKEG
ncbi:MAG: PTS system trehalose-specific EIIBC component [Spirochaetaceae bacterium]|jgi:PTS system trehalose-specific IIC component|nr:PTS system trehalose-specific EIIBC component [Spirochaetaceae bacterium]